MNNSRGYFGIGIYHGKTETNIGTLWRSAYQFGASFIFTIGRRYKKQSSDTLKTHRHVPLYNYLSFDDFIKNRPYGCPIVPIEFVNDNDLKLEVFKHPSRCIYLLGAEDYGLPLDRLGEVDYNPVRIPSTRTESFNVAVAGSIVMYDRFIKNIIY